MKYKLILTTLTVMFSLNAFAMHETENIAHAASQKDIVKVKALIQSNADINARDKYDRTALHYAAVFDDQEIFEELLKCPDLILDLQADDGNTPLHCAILEGCSFPVVQLALRGASWDISNNERQTPLDSARGSVFEVLYMYCMEQK